MKQEAASNLAVRCNDVKVCKKAQGVTVDGRAIGRYVMRVHAPAANLRFQLGA